MNWFTARKKDDTADTTQPVTRRSGWVTVLRFGLLLAILAFGGWYIATHFDRIAGNARFTPVNVLLLILLNVCTIFIESTRLRLQVRKLGCNIGPTVSWHLIALIQAVNHIVLKAGTFSGGWYLSRRYGISFTAYVALVVTYIVVLVLGSGVLGLAVSFLFLALGQDIPLFVPAFFFGLTLISVAVLTLARVRLPLHRFPKITVRFLESVRFIYSDYRLLVALVGVEMLYYLASALRFMTALSMFSGQAGLMDGVTVVTVGNFMRIASIVPGGLGIAELASGWAAGILGADAGLAGLSAGLDRLTYVLLVMLFGGVGFLAVSGGKSFFHPSPNKVEFSES